MVIGIKQRFGSLLIIAGVLLYLLVLHNIAKNDWEDVKSQTDIETYCAIYHPDRPESQRNEVESCIEWTKGELEGMAIGKGISAILVFFGLLLLFNVQDSPYEKEEPDDNNQGDKLSQLEKLGELKDKGLLSEDEFQKEKDKILNP